MDTANGDLGIISLVTMDMYGKPQSLSEDYKSRKVFLSDR